jgi:hypothetical protein
MSRFGIPIYIEVAKLIRNSFRVACRLTLIGRAGSAPGCEPAQPKVFPQ